MSVRYAWTAWYHVLVDQGELMMVTYKSKEYQPSHLLATSVDAYAELPHIL